MLTHADLKELQDAIQSGKNRPSNLAKAILFSVVIAHADDILAAIQSTLDRPEGKGTAEFEDPGYPVFTLYTEDIQDAAERCHEAGKLPAEVSARLAQISWHDLGDIAEAMLDSDWLVDAWQETLEEAAQAVLNIRFSNGFPDHMDDEE